MSVNPHTRIIYKGAMRYAHNKKEKQQRRKYEYVSKETRRCIEND